MLTDSLGWGFGLWLIGYVLGVVLFMALPPWLLGWVITPIGTCITLWVLLRRVKAGHLQYYAILAITWTAIAIVLDYLFIVVAFDPPDGYYKLDVYVYYTLTLMLPLMVGWWKTSPRREHLRA